MVVLQTWRIIMAWIKKNLLFNACLPRVSPPPVHADRASFVPHEAGRFSHPSRPTCQFLFVFSSLSHSLPRSPFAPISPVVPIPPHLHIFPPLIPSGFITVGRHGCRSARSPQWEERRQAARHHSKGRPHEAAAVAAVKPKRGGKKKNIESRVHGRGGSYAAHGEDSSWLPVDGGAAS